MNKSQRAALVVFFSLLAALIGGLIAYFSYANQPATAVPLLAGCVLVAFVLVLAAARIVNRFRRSRKLAEEHHVPPSRTLHALDLRQWLTLVVGITVIALATGAFTAVRVLAADDDETVTLPPVATTPAPVLTTEPVLASPSATEPPADPADPSDGIESAPTEATETATPDEFESAPAEPTDVPVPEATKYLDAEEPIDGSYDARAVAFSAQRHTRGIQFYCSTAARSALQWNVAGMTRFSAAAGIDDAMTNTFGKAVEFQFYDQDGRKLGKPVEVSVGHPRNVRLDLAGVVSLRMTCATRDAKTNEERTTYAALGDPLVASE